MITVKSFVAIIAVFLLFQSAGIAQQNPDLKVGANMYNLGFGSAPATCFDGSQDSKNGCVGKWIASNIYLSSSASSPVCRPTSSTVCIGGFLPGSVPYLSDMYWIRDAVGISQYEKSLLHFTQDSGFTFATGLIAMDQFDWFDQTNGLTEGFRTYHSSQAANGVLLYHGATFVSDLTGPAYDGAPQTIPSGDTLYVSYMEPFDQVNVSLATARAGGSVSYEYSKGNGVWGDLTTAPHWNDPTDGLRSGTGAQIGFYPPADWAQDVMRGARSKFWTRITVTGATTAPAINLHGDNLRSTLVSPSRCGTVTGCFLRGWSESAYQASTACGGVPCVVAGTYKYNPNPPATSSARFIYQARSGGYGGYGNNVWLNPSMVDSSTGKMLAGEVMPYLWAVAAAASGINLSNLNGAILDNAASNIPHMYPSWQPNKTDLACVPSCSEANGNSTFDNYWALAFAQSTASFHSSYGSSFLATGNVSANWPSTLLTVGPSLDLSWLENSLSVTAGGNFQGSTTTAQNTFDLGLHGIPVSVAEIDSNKAGYCDTNYSPCIPLVWNRGVRGSMVALGNHYLFGNPHAILTYSITGMAIYNVADHYYYFGDATTLTAPMSRGVYTAPHGFSVASVAPLVAMTSASCVQPGCGGTENPYTGNAFVRLCPTAGNCEDGDVFQVTTQPPSTVTITPNAGSSVAIANSYSGSERVQVVHYGHAAYPIGPMPPWKDVMVYGTAPPAFRVDIGVPDTTNGWQPPSGNCGYSTCHKGDRDMFVGTSCSTLYCSAQQWSALPCVNGKYNSPLAGGRSRDCSPVARRDYTNAIVLMRTARTGGTLPTAPEEWTTYSKPIDLSSFEARCAPNCLYQKLEADGTRDPETSSIALRGSEAAVLMKTTGGGQRPAAPVLGPPTLH